MESRTFTNTFIIINVLFLLERCNARCSRQSLAQDETISIQRQKRLCARRDSLYSARRDCLCARRESLQRQKRWSVRQTRVSIAPEEMVCAPDESLYSARRDGLCARLESPAPGKSLSIPCMRYDYTNTHIINIMYMLHASIIIV